MTILLKCGLSALLTTGAATMTNPSPLQPLRPFPQYFIVNWKGRITILTACNFGKVQDSRPLMSVRRKAPYVIYVNHLGPITEIEWW